MSSTEQDMEQTGVTDTFDPTAYRLGQDERVIGVRDVTRWAMVWKTPKGVWQTYAHEDSENDAHMRIRAAASNYPMVRWGYFDPHPHGLLAKGLRELADFLEAHPELPAFRYAEVNRHLNDRDEFIAAAKALDGCAISVTTNWFAHATLQFGPVTLDYQTDTCALLDDVDTARQQRARAALNKALGRTTDDDATEAA